MNYTKNLASCKQNLQTFKYTDKYIGKNALNASLLFSYLISPDTNKKEVKKVDKKRIIQDYIYQTKSKFYKQVLKKHKNYNDYINAIFIKCSAGFIKLDYKKSQEYKIKDDINYKNSYIKYAYEKLKNPMSIFTTTTLNSNKYHPFFNDGKILNPILENSDNPKQAFDKMIYDGYTKLEEAREDFYKQRVFRDDKLTKDKRALILAIEPHKTFVPHTHKLEIIEKKYIKEYVHFTIENHQKFELGRTEIALFKKAFDIIKDDYELTFKKTKNGDLYFLNDYIYFKVLEQKSDTEIQSISNYMTKYIEQSYIINGDEFDKNKDMKKNSVLYSAFALYIASLKDKFIPKKDGTKYKKIRRIRYARLLISKEVYRNIMTKEFIEYLKKIGKYHKHNMYFHITKLLESKKLKIYRYYKINMDSGEIIREKVYYYDVYLADFHQRIDVMMNKVFKMSKDGLLFDIRKYIKIDLDLHSHYKERYNYKDDNECIIIDKDVI